MTDEEKRIAGVLRQWEDALVLFGKGNQKCVRDLGEAGDMIEKLSSDRDAWKLMAEAAMRDIRYGQSCDNCKYAGNSYGEDPCPDEEQLDEDSCQNWEWRGL